MPSKGAHQLPLAWNSRSWRGNNVPQSRPHPGWLVKWRFTMDFDLTDAQKEIVLGVQALCQRFPDDYWRDKDARREFPHDFYKAVAEAGFLGIAIPEEYGGSGLGI